VAVTILAAVASGLGAPVRAQDDKGGGGTPLSVELVGAFFPADLAQHLPQSGGWLPLYVELRARGARPQIVTLEAVVEHTTDSQKVVTDYETRSRFEVPPGRAPLRAWLYVWTRPGESFGHTVKLRYLCGGRSVPIGSVGNGGSVSVDSDQEGVLPMFVVSDEEDHAAPWGQKLSTQRDLRSGPWISSDAVERLRPHQLPDRILGYDSVRQVVLRGVDETRLEPAQVAALRRWVYLGGSLVFAPRGKSDRVFEGALFKEIFGDVLAPQVRRDDAFRPQNLYLVERKEGVSSSTRPYARGALVGLRQESQGFSLMDPFADGPSIVREIRSSRLASLVVRRADPGRATLPPFFDARRGELPGERVYVEVSFGAGRVGALTIDDETFRMGDSRPLRQALWQKIVRGGGRRGTGRWQLDPVQKDLHDAMKDEKRDVGTFVISGIIILYLLLVGPGVYFFLKGRGRLPSIVWVEPAVIVVYLGVIFATGYLTKGYLTKMRMVTFFHQRVGDPFALRDSYLGIFSADASLYQIDSPRGEILAPVFANENERESLDLTQGQGSARTGAGDADDGERRLRLRGYHLDLWQQGVVWNCGIEALDGEVTVERLEDDGKGRPRYRVRNGLGWAIRGGRLHPWDDGGLVGPGGLEVGEIPSGASRRIGVGEGPGAADVPEGEERHVVTRELRARYEALRRRGLAYPGAPLLWLLLDRSDDSDFRIDRPFSLSEKLDFYVLHAN